MFLYTNLVRAYPKKFYELYKNYVLNSGDRAKLTSNRYYTSLTKELKSMAPVSILLPEDRMFELAECWAIESGEKGLVGHDRVSCPGGYSGENCSYGYETGLDIVMQLLIDEGIKSLGHRKNILLPDFKGLGVAIRRHSGYRYCGVQNFSYTNDKLKKQKEVQQLEAAKEREALAKRMEERANEFKTLMGRWTERELANADAARNANYLNEFEKDLYFYLNLMRLYPKKFKATLWDNGPYFDQFLDVQKNGLHKETSYKRVARWLDQAVSKQAFVPKKEAIDISRCIVKRYVNKSGNPSGCVTGFRSWRLKTFYESTNYDDVIQILLDDEDFEDLFSSDAILAVQPSDPYMVKVFLKK